jgi:hypothetical protein
MMPRLAFSLGVTMTTFVWCVVEGGQVAAIKEEHKAAVALIAAIAR